MRHRAYYKMRLVVLRRLSHGRNELSRTVGLSPKVTPRVLVRCSIPCRHRRNAQIGAGVIRQVTASTGAAFAAQFDSPEGLSNTIDDRGTEGGDIAGGEV